jgi:hypothetical protein
VTGVLVVVGVVVPVIAGMVVMNPFRRVRCDLVLRVLRIARLRRLPGRVVLVPVLVPVGVAAVLAVPVLVWVVISVVVSVHGSRVR